MKSVKNVPGSVRQRLLDRARKDCRPFNELLQYYAIERFLYRLSLSAHSDRFVLKGALLLRVWDSPEIRPTMDIDMLRITSNTEADIIKQVKDILSVDVEADGLFFDPDSIRNEQITEDADYKGHRQCHNPPATDDRKAKRIQSHPDQFRGNRQNQGPGNRDPERGGLTKGGIR